MVGCLEVCDLELDVLDTIVVPSGIAALPGTML
jgi:hypothetical protein